MINLLTPKNMAIIQSPVSIFALRDILEESPKDVENMSRRSVLVFPEYASILQCIYVKSALDIDLECDLASCI